MHVPIWGDKGSAHVTAHISISIWLIRNATLPLINDLWLKEFSSRIPKSFSYTKRPFRDVGPFGESTKSSAIKTFKADFRLVWGEFGVFFLFVFARASVGFNSILIFVRENRGLEVFDLVEVIRVSRDVLSLTRDRVVWFVWVFEMWVVFFFFNINYLICVSMIRFMYFILLCSKLNCYIDVTSMITIQDLFC